jgi:lysophospholipase L1-like esterase
VLGAEYYLQAKYGETTIKGGDGKRFITLREHQPKMDTIKTPHEKPDDPDKVIRDTIKMKDYKFSTDENGFINPTREHESQDMTLVFLGGSTTECMYVSESKRFPYLSGKILGKKLNKKVNSLNGGVAGNNSLHSLNVLLNKTFPIEPDIAVMMHNINDIIILMFEKTYWNNNRSRRPIISKYDIINELEYFDIADQNPIKKLIYSFTPNLYYKTKSIYWRMYPAEKKKEQDEFAHIRAEDIIDLKDTKEKQYIIDQFKMNLQVFVNMCRASKIIPVLMTQGNRFTDNPDKIVLNHFNQRIGAFGVDYKYFKAAYDSFNESIKEVGKDNNVPVIDLAQKVPQTNEYFYDVIHFNDKGSTLVAKIIAEELSNVLND